VGSCGLNSSGSGQGLVVGPCEHGNEPSGSIKGGESHQLMATSFSRRILLHGVN
jgi:hypothetical protein